MSDFESLFRTSIPWWQFIVRAALIYIVFFVGLRLFGKRELGQFTTFDLVLVLLVANALQPAITGPDTSITGGIVIVLTLLLFNRMVAMVRSQWPWFDHLIEPPPTQLVKNGQILSPNLAKEGLNDDDIQMAVREHGVNRLSDVKAAYLENDGSISVVTHATAGYRRRRRMRFTRR